MTIDKWLKETKEICDAAKHLKQYTPPKTILSEWDALCDYVAESRTRLPQAVEFLERLVAFCKESEENKVRFTGKYVLDRLNEILSEEK